MSTEQPASIPRLALSGVVAALCGVAVGHLVAAVTTVSASPVLAVGYAVIDRTPTAVKEWAIAHFGTADKPILLSGIAVLTVLWSVVAGALGRRAWRTLVAFAVLAAVSSWAALSRPTAAPAWIIPSLVTLAVAGAAFLGLRRLAGAGGGSTAAPGAGTAGRRAFLAGTGGVVALGALAAVAGQKLSSATSTIGKALPAPFRRAAPVPAGLERQVPGLTPLRTPTESFYRVDTALTLPTVEREDWRLVIDGDVGRRVELGYADIAGMRLIEKNITMTCVSNEVGGEYVGGATWTGVPVRDLLALAGVTHPTRADAQVLSTSVDGFTASTPLEAMLDGREALLAIGMNGQALPRQHGYPARLVVPGLYGMLGSTKWVTRLTVTTYAQRAYWTQRGWSDRAPIKPSARIDQPQSLATVPRGVVTIGGIAWAQGRGVRAVEVQLDGGPWHRATLGPSVNDDYWRQWMYRWDAGSAATGQHTVSARVIDGHGQVQTPRRAAPLPNGSSGLQERVFLLQ